MHFGLALGLHPRRAMPHPRPWPAMSPASTHSTCSAPSPSSLGTLHVLPACLYVALRDTATTHSPTQPAQSSLFPEAEALSPETRHLQPPADRLL